MMDSGGFHAAASSMRQTSTEPKIAPAVRRRNSGSDFGRTSPNPGKSIKNRTFFSGSSSGSTLFQTGGVITRCQPKQERRDNPSLLRRAIAVCFDRDPHNPWPTSRSNDLHLHDPENAISILRSNPSITQPQFQPSEIRSVESLQRSDTSLL